MLVIGLILFGMLVGAAAQLILGRSTKGIDWGLAIVAGLIGSFVGGLLISLLSGDGLAASPQRYHRLARGCAARHRRLDLVPQE